MYIGWTPSTEPWSVNSATRLNLYNPRLQYLPQPDADIYSRWFQIDCVCMRAIARRTWIINAAIVRGEEFCHVFVRRSKPYGNSTCICPTSPIWTLIFRFKFIWSPDRADMVSQESPCSLYTRVSSFTTDKVPLGLGPYQSSTLGYFTIKVVSQISSIPLILVIWNLVNVCSWKFKTTVASHFSHYVILIIPSVQNQSPRRYIYDLQWDMNYNFGIPPEIVISVHVHMSPDSWEQAYMK